MSLRPPATTTAAMLPEIERDTLGTVIAVTGKTARVQLAGGDVVSGIDATGVSVGQSLRMRYAGGTYVVQGGAGGGSSGGGSFAGGSGGVSGAPSPHDLLGVHHNLPTLAANLFLSSPVSASGLPAFRAIGPADLPGQFAGFANPSAQIGMTAVNGSATTAMRSDAAPAINAAIAPTWSGVHTFNAGLTVPHGQNINFGADVALTRFGANVLTTGADDSVRSPNFVSGIAGWTIDGTGDAEFNNIVVRGELRAFVFKINELAATAGTFGVFYSAATVYADFATPASTGSSFTFQAKNTDAGAMLLGVNDVCRTKAWNGAGIVDCWFTVTARTNNTTYTTYTATLNSGSTSATIREGTAIVDYGPNAGTTGFITLSADGTVGSSPNITLATHAGAPWTTITPQMRIGNLNGYGSYATNVYGVAIGAPAGTWNSWDTTNGIRFLNGANVIAQWDASGNITIGRVATSQANTYISAGEIQFRTNTTSYFKIASTGRVVLTQGTAAENSINWESGTDTVSQIFGYRGGGRSYATLISYGYSGNAGITELVAYTPNNTSGYARLWLDGVYKTIVADNPFLANGGVVTSSVSASSGVLGLSGVTGVSLQGGVLTTNTVGVSIPNWLVVGNYTVSQYGGIGAGLTTKDYTPTSGTWPDESTLVLSALNYSTIGFHDSGSRVDFIRVGAGQMTLGYDGGFGAAQVAASNSFGVGMFAANNTYDRLSVSGGAKLFGGNAGYAMEARDNSGQTWVVYANGSNYRIFQGQDLIRFDTSGNASKLSAGTAWSSFSDARVKKIKGAYKRGLAEILQMRPIIYDYNGEAGTIPNGRDNAGIIAQELREIFPDAVTEDSETGLLMFDATEITWALVNAVKALHAKLEAMQR